MGTCDTTYADETDSVHFHLGGSNPGANEIGEDPMSDLLWSQQPLTNRYDGWPNSNL